MVKTNNRKTLIEDDPDDNKFIECAVSTKSNFIVTGDKHLLMRKHYERIKNESIYKVIGFALGVR